jgi:hypothetical protein
MYWTAKAKFGKRVSLYGRKGCSSTGRSCGSRRRGLTKECESTSRGVECSDLIKISSGIQKYFRIRRLIEDWA